MSVDRDELVDHVQGVCALTALPVSVDAEQCFPGSPGGVAETVARLAGAGAVGCSIEDWDPYARSIKPVATAVDRVREAAAAAHASGLVLTARAENHLRGRDDLDDTLSRLAAYAGAGADVVYAPALPDLAAITRVVAEAGAPVNVLLRPGGPTVPELAAAGVRRISVGGTLAWVAYGALVRAAEELLASGTIGPELPYLSPELASAAFTPAAG
jgi:2-methylisocitrate lyase-like PEP mutase family enzyme